MYTKKTIVITRLFACFFIYCFVGTSIWAQTNLRDSFPDPYQVNPLISLPLAVGGLLLQPLGVSNNQKKPGISNETLAELEMKNVNFFDRIALRQNLSTRKKAGKFSDVGLIFGAASPLLLFLDRKSRRNWVDFTIMHLEAQAIAGNLQSWGPFGPLLIDRYRPIVYYANAPLEERNFGALRNSFYSGHTSVAAAGTFLTAQVYLDHHPELRGKRWLIYGLAAIPTAWVGVNRVRALRHFPTDSLVGGLVGAATGIFVPWLHRQLKGKMSVSMLYEEEFKGMALILRF